MKEVEALFNIKITTAKSLDGDINYSNKKYVLETTSGTKHILKIFPDQAEWVLAKYLKISPLPRVIFFS
jgi:hypothetical protein